MRSILKNRVVLIFYVSIICFAFLWMWRVERLEENNIEYDDMIVLSTNY